MHQEELHLNIWMLLGKLNWELLNEQNKLNLLSPGFCRLVVFTLVNIGLECEMGDWQL